MAKSKAPLTPEQVEAKKMKKEKASANWNSFLAVVLAIALTVGVVMVGKSTAEKRLETGINADTPEDYVDTDLNNNSNDYLVDEETGEIIVDENGEPVTNPDSSTGEEDNSEENKTPDRELPANPAEWTKAEVVNFYKKAAQKSTSVKSIQTMTMDNGMNVKLNNGALEFLIGMAEPVIKLALKANSVEFDGITGGYDKLVPSDVKGAKAYKEGNYTIVEMSMVEQTDDAYGDMYSGTVGHAISVVGNIAIVADQFPDWTINFKDAYVALRYVNPKLKVRINEKGIIEKGTWSYVVDVEVKNLQIEKVVVEHATTEINYVVKTGGGF